jgi:hypothetical protein
MATLKFRDWELGNRETERQHQTAMVANSAAYCVGRTDSDVLPELRDLIDREPGGTRRCGARLRDGDDFGRGLCWRCVIRTDCTHDRERGWKAGETVDSPFGVLTVRKSGSHCPGCGRFDAAIPA